MVNFNIIIVTSEESIPARQSLWAHQSSTARRLSRQGRAVFSLSPLGAFYVGSVALSIVLVHKNAGNFIWHAGYVRT
jgi:hypothetical protein